MADWEVEMDGWKVEIRCGWMEIQGGGLEIPDPVRVLLRKHKHHENTTCLTE